MPEPLEQNSRNDDEKRKQCLWSLDRNNFMVIADIWHFENRVLDQLTADGLRLSSL